MITNETRKEGSRMESISHNAEHVKPAASPGAFRDAVLDVMRAANWVPPFPVALITVPKGDGAVEVIHFRDEHGRPTVRQMTAEEVAREQREHLRDLADEARRYDYEDERDDCRDYEAERQAS